MGPVRALASEQYSQCTSNLEGLPTNNRGLIDVWDVEKNRRRAICQFPGSRTRMASVLLSHSVKPESENGLSRMLAHGGGGQNHDSPNNEFSRSRRRSRDDW